MPEIIDVSQRERKLVQLWESGVDSSAVAWHGTSLETIKALLVTGNIPGYSRENTSLRTKGDIHFFPDGSRFPFSKVQNPNTEDIEEMREFTAQEAMRGASGYAGQIAERHYFFSQLDLSLRTPVHLGAFFNDLDRGTSLEQSEDYETVLELVGSNRQLKLLTRLARRRRGVLIGLPPVAFEEYPVLHGDPGDLKIQTGHLGLGIDFISGIKPLGGVEEQFMRGLKDFPEDVEVLW